VRCFNAGSIVEEGDHANTTRRTWDETTAVFARIVAFVAD
jgi:hypothetical protein